MHTKSVAVGHGKGNVWVATPRPGAHGKGENLPLILVVRDILGYADNSREAGRILQNGDILVDGRARKDPKFGIGLMDVVEIPKIKKSFRVLPDKKGMRLREIPEKESKTKLYKVMDKRVLGKGKVQLNLHDSRNIIINAEESSAIKSKDTVAIDFSEKGKIKKVLHLAKGSIGLITKGRHSGKSGEISEITESTQMRSSVTKIGDFQTLTNYVFVIGEKNKPSISV